MTYLKHPVAVMLLAVFMMVLGIVIPLLMVLQIIESTFFLNFLAFALSVGGLFLGIIGVATVVRRK